MITNLNEKDGYLIYPLFFQTNTFYSGQTNSSFDKLPSEVSPSWFPTVPPPPCSWPCPWVLIRSNFAWQSSHLPSHPLASWNVGYKYLIWDAQAYNLFHQPAIAIFSAVVRIVGLHFEIIYFCEQTYFICDTLFEEWEGDSCWWKLSMLHTVMIYQSNYTFTNNQIKLSLSIKFYFHFHIV